MRPASTRRCAGRSSSSGWSRPSRCSSPTGSRRLVANLVLAVALAGAATGPAAYTLNTVATPHTGSIVTAGPVSSQGGPGGTRGGFTPGEAGRDGRRTFPDGGTPQGQTGQSTTGRAAGLGQSGTASTALVQLLQADAGRFRWAAATIGSQSAATYQLAGEQPVMAIGGFTGSDPSPTLAQFQALRGGRRRPLLHRAAAGSAAAVAAARRRSPPG